MSDPKYPFGETENLESNLSELFERISIVPKGSQPGNFDGFIQENLGVSIFETVIYHNLGRIPVGYLVLSRTEPCDVLIVSKNNNDMIIKATGSSTITLLVL